MKSLFNLSIGAVLVSNMLYSGATLAGVEHNVSTVEMEKHSILVENVRAVSLVVSKTITVDDCNHYGITGELLKVDSGDAHHLYQPMLAELNVIGTEIYCPGPEREVYIEKSFQVDADENHRVGLKVFMSKGYQVEVLPLYISSNLELDLLEAKSALVEFAEQNNSCETAAECTAVTAGHRACGGPSTFVIVSNEMLKLNEGWHKLDQLAENFSALEAQYNLENGVISICSLLSAPSQFSCQAGTCVTK